MKSNVHDELLYCTGSLTLSDAEFTFGLGDSGDMSGGAMEGGVPGMSQIGRVHAHGAVLGSLLVQR